ncbi:MAG: hypothetical protein SGPRY_001139 [Prymnesium sp.]
MMLLGLRADARIITRGCERGSSSAAEACCGSGEEACCASDEEAWSKAWWGGASKRDEGTSSDMAASELSRTFPVAYGTLRYAVG